MPKLVNRAKVTTATTGTGTMLLGSAVAGFQGFLEAGVLDLDTVRYVIEDGDNWEIGAGVYNLDTLSRGPTESSNSGAAINLSGSAVVYVTATERDITGRAAAMALIFG